MRNALIAGVALIGGLAVPLPRTAHAQNVHQDPRGRFTIDLPPGFSLTSEQLDRFYIFQVAEARLFVSVASGASDLELLWRSALDDFTGPGVQAPLAPAVSDLEVNGNPARMAWYALTSGPGGGSSTPFTVLLGAVVLRGSGTGVVCFALLNEKAAGQWGDALRKAFRSIRVAGPPVVSGP